MFVSVRAAETRGPIAFLLASHDGQEKKCHSIKCIHVVVNVLPCRQRIEAFFYALRIRRIPAFPGGRGPAMLLWKPDG